MQTTLRSAEFSRPLCNSNTVVIGSSGHIEPKAPEKTGALQKLRQHEWNCGHRASVVECGCPFCRFSFDGTFGWHFHRTACRAQLTGVDGMSTLSLHDR